MHSFNCLQVSESALATLQECREKQFQGCSAQFQNLEVIKEKKGNTTTYIKEETQFPTECCRALWTLITASSRLLASPIQLLRGFERSPKSRGFILRQDN